MILHRVGSRQDIKADHDDVEGVGHDRTFGVLYRSDHTLFEAADARERSWVFLPCTGFLKFNHVEFDPLVV